MNDPKVRVFISSPSDLQHERALVRQIIESLAPEYLPYFRIEPVLWEQEALTAAQCFQAGLVRPSECEIVLVMLWTRLGTPLADDPYRGMTGTEWEFVDAVEASARPGEPEVLVYRKTAPRLVDITNREATAIAVSDRDRLETFLRRHFFNEDGSFRRAFREFDSDAGLRDLVETQLRKLLNRRIGAERRFAAGTSDWHGSPFRAGRPFDVADARIFTGREGDIRELITRLEALRNDGPGLLLITGASGSGKSSLVRAGLIPHLIRPFLFAGLAACRWCLVDLAGGTDPIRAMAEALFATATLGGSLEALGLTAERLTGLAVSQPRLAAEQIQAAIEHAERDLDTSGGGSDGSLRLAILLDPLDPILAAEAAASDRVQRASELLAALAHQGRVWVIATLRSDRLALLPGLPALSGAIDEARWYPLEPPAPVRIRQVMEIPARVAGIEYEERAGTAAAGILEALEAEAAATRHWPPLLEQTLEDLYHQAMAGRGSGGGNRGLVLGIQDYRRIGGLTGSLVRMADACWAALAPAAREALPFLCRALIELDSDARSRPSPREGDLRTLMGDPGCTALLDALVAARLLVVESVADAAREVHCALPSLRLGAYFRAVLAETGEEWRTRLGFKPKRAAFAPAAETTGAADASHAAESIDWSAYRPIARFVHPALLTRWQPVRDWLADPGNRRDLILRTRIARQAHLWKRTDCNPQYLFGEAGFAEAHAFAERHAAEMEPPEQELLTHSWTEIQLRRRRNRVTLGATLAVLLLFATVAGYALWDARYEARIGRQKALLRASDIALERGDPLAAVRLAWKAGEDLPQEAIHRIARAIAGNRLLATLMPGALPGAHWIAPAFSADAGAVVTYAAETGARRWRLEDGRYRGAGTLATPGTAIAAIRIAGDGPSAQVVGIGPDGVWILPAGDGQTPDRPADGPPDWPCGAEGPIEPLLDPSGRRLAVVRRGAAGADALCVLDLTEPGRALWDQTFADDPIRDLAFSPDGGRIALASREGRVLLLETATGAQSSVLPREGTLGRPAMRVAFDRQGRRLAVATLDEQVRILGLDGTAPLTLGKVKRGDRLVAIHQSSVRALAFSPDGRILLVGDGTGQLVRWDLASGSPEVMGEHELGIEGIAITAEVDPHIGEHLALSLSQDGTVRLWRLQSGKLLTMLGQGTAISDAAFTPDGRRVITVSARDGSARLWSVEPANGLAFRVRTNDHLRDVALAALPADSGEASSLLMATAGHDGEVAVWRWREGTAPARYLELEGHDGPVRRVAFSPSGRRLASAGSDGTARVWDLASGHGCRLPVAAQVGAQVGAAPGACARPDARDCPAVYQALFAPDERWLVTAASERQQPVRLWDPITCTALPQPPAFDSIQGSTRSLAVAPGTSGALLLASGSNEGAIHLLRQDPRGAWAGLCAFDARGEGVRALAFSPDGHWLTAARRDGRTWLMGIAADGCAEPRVLDGDAGRLYDVRFSPDGQLFVTAAFDAKAQVWSLDGTLLAELVGQRNRIGTASFSPDGRWIMTGSRDGTIAIWRRPTRRAAMAPPPYLILDADLGAVTNAVFDPSGRTVAAAYWDEAAVIWRLWSEDPDPPRALVAHWGKERARLALIGEAARYLRELEGITAEASGGEAHAR